MKTNISINNQESDSTLILTAKGTYKELVKLKRNLESFESHLTEVTKERDERRGLCDEHFVELIKIVAEVVVEQAGREVSGLQWGDEQCKRLNDLRLAVCKLTDSELEG